MRIDITVVSQPCDDALDWVDYSYDASWELADMASDWGDPLELLCELEDE